MGRITEDNVTELVEDSFPAPDFRKYQDWAIENILEQLYVEGKDVVLLNAPTGSGKSLICYTVGKSAGSTFLTTPLNTLVDQYQSDDFFGDKIVTLKGRNNYQCIHPDDTGTDVDKAICQRDSDFDCGVKGQCPYYGRKARAIGSQVACTNMSYLMAEGLIPRSEENEDSMFGFRDVLELDECQNLEDFAMNFISFTVSPRTVPDSVWNNITLPDERKEGDMDFLVDWLRNEVLKVAREAKTRLDSIMVMDDDELDDAEQISQFIMRVENFLDDVEDNEWVAEKDVEIRKNKDNVEKWVFEPLVVGRFLDDLLWSRGEKIVLASATMPNDDWVREMGLGDKLDNDEVARINVPSTFPVENRPIYMGHAVGKMTYNKRDDNYLPMAKKIKRLADHHSGENGFIHCRSYGIAKALRRTFKNNGMRDFWKNRCFIQDKYDREGSLEEWLNSDEQVFFSVAMDEGIDLEGDDCRWQALAKVLYPSMANKRVKKRVDELGHWDWYNQKAATQIQQAYGRAVRSPEDEAVFYCLDSSAKGLIKRNAGMFNKWFLEAIDDMAIDPDRGI